MFSDELEKISWDETTKSIYAKTATHVVVRLAILGNVRR